MIKYMLFKFCHNKKTFNWSSLSFKNKTKRAPTWFKNMKLKKKRRGMF